MPDWSDIGVIAPKSGGSIADIFNPDQQAKFLALGQARAFQSDLPTTNGDPKGPIDWDAVSRRMIQTGDFQHGIELQNLALQRQLMQQGQSAPSPFSTAPAPSGAPTASPTGSAGPMGVFRNAISNIESSGQKDPYSAIGPQTGSGDQAYGKYQVMGSNIGPWTKEVLGQSMTPQQFLANPQAQDAVFDAKFGGYLKQTGNPRDAASMWFTGKPYAQGQNRSDVNGTTDTSYVDRFMSALPGSRAPQPNSNNGLGLSKLPDSAVIGANDEAASPHPYGPGGAMAGSPSAAPPPAAGGGAAGPFGAIGNAIQSKLEQAGNRIQNSPIGRAIAGLGAPPPQNASPVPPPAPQGLQVASNGASDAPSPAVAIAPGAGAGGPAAAAPAPTQPMPGQGAPAPVVVAQNDANGAGPLPSSIAPTANGPIPKSPAPAPPLSPKAGDPFPMAPGRDGSLQPLDPTFGGQVPKAFLDAGYTPGDYVRYAYSMAGMLGNNPYAKAKSEAWMNLAKGLATSIDRSLQFTTEQKNARDPYVLGLEQRKADIQNTSRVAAENSPFVVNAKAQLAGREAQARVDAETAAAGPKAEAEGQGKYLGELPGKLATTAEAASQTSNLVDEMLAAGNQFRMGAGAQSQQNFNAKMLALADVMGVDPGTLRTQVGGAQDFNKLSGQLVRQSIKETGSNRAGIQEMQMVSGTLPTPDMSKDGFRTVGSQIKGVSDYHIARQQAGQTWLDQHGTMRGFEADWNQNVSPAAFVMHRLQVDQPDLFQASVQKLAQTPQGRTALQHIRSGLAYGAQTGLFGG